MKPKLQYFGHLMRRADSLEKTLMLGKIEGRRRRGRQRMWWLDGITDSMDMGLGGLQELVMDKEAGVLWFMGSQRVGHDSATELNWIKPNENSKLPLKGPGGWDAMWRQRKSRDTVTLYVEVKVFSWASSAAEPSEDCVTITAWQSPGKNFLDDVVNPQNDERKWYLNH